MKTIEVSDETHHLIMLAYGIQKGELGKYGEHDRTIDDTLYNITNHWLKWWDHTYINVVKE